MVHSISHLGSFYTTCQSSHCMIPRTIQKVVHMYELFVYIFVFEGDNEFFASQIFDLPS